MLLGFNETKQILEKYDLPMAKTILLTRSKTISNAQTTSLEEENKLKEATKQVGFPLVLKVFSTNVLHRTEKGLLKTNIQNEKEASQAFEEFIAKSKNDKGFEGILAQEQLKGIELFCGLKQDPTFGPVLMFGLGGIFVEALNDIAFGICPLTLKEAKEMITSLKGKKVLGGFRNQPKVDLNVLALLLRQISILGAKNPQIKELDFNPIIANAKSIKIADVKILK
ncbi:MAG: acetate--CoA ligase family protein [bacterium]|nr:acetate--CoA ligase family protein [bacterium]